MRDTGAGTLARRCEYFIRRTPCAHDVQRGHTYCGYHNLFMEFTIFYRQGSTCWQIRNDVKLLKEIPLASSLFYFSFPYIERTLFDISLTFYAQILWIKF